MVLGMVIGVVIFVIGVLFGMAVERMPRGDNYKN